LSDNPSPDASSAGSLDHPNAEPQAMTVDESEVELVDDHDDVDETIDHPAKVMRIGSMLKQLLEELRSMDLDEPSRERLKSIYETSITEVGGALSEDLREELGRIAIPFGEDETPSAAELHIAKAQLVGWLEGLVQGMQAMLFAQQMVARQQLQSMRGQLDAGSGAAEAPIEDLRPGTYL